MRNHITLLPIILCLILSFSATSQKIHIKVGAGIRPPFLLANNNGLGIDILNAFNLVQSQFTFELIPVPIARRVESLREGWVDIVMWDNIQWGWDEHFSLIQSTPLLTTKDTFVSFFSENKDQSYFNNLKNKRICAVNGYHYKLFNYETDYRKLKSQYNISLIRTEAESIKMALLKRCDISIASLSAIDWFLTSNPDAREKLIISEKFDTQYSRHFLVPKYASISVEEVNAIYYKAKELNLLAPIYHRYGQNLNTTIQK
ncbi:MAG: substrate-binding periplasmic protein [Thalassotalea sp.]